MQTTRCTWVMGSGMPCGEPTKYTMVDDGGEPGAAKVRKYDHLCPMHRDRKRMQ